jgi:hypothetical protein
MDGGASFDWRADRAARPVLGSAVVAGAQDLATDKEEMTALTEGRR